MLNPNKPKQLPYIFDSSLLRHYIQVCQDNSLSSAKYSFSKKKKDYVVIEVAGMPRSYKSTLILSSIVNMRTSKISADCIRERPININKGEEPLRYTVAISNNAMHKLWEEKGHKKVLFLDRGVYDRLAFLKVYQKLGQITKHEVEKVSDLLIHIYADEIDGLIICNSTANMSLQREGIRKSPGTIMNKEFLNNLANEYENFPELILKKRKKAVFSHKPLFITQLDSTATWQTYADDFLRAVGSIYKLS